MEMRPPALRTMLAALVACLLTLPPSLLMARAAMAEVHAACTVEIAGEQLGGKTLTLGCAVAPTRAPSTIMIVLKNVLSHCMSSISGMVAT